MSETIAKAILDLTLVLNWTFAVLVVLVGIAFYVTVIRWK